jgi:hypothetical protein
MTKVQSFSDSGGKQETCPAGSGLPGHLRLFSPNRAVVLTSTPRRGIVSALPYPPYQVSPRVPTGPQQLLTEGGR